MKDFDSAVLEDLEQVKAKRLNLYRDVYFKVLNMFDNNIIESSFWMATPRVTFNELSANDAILSNSSGDIVLEAINTYVDIRSIP